VSRQSLSIEQRESRAKNAVAAFLFRQLIVPKVFFDARWPGRGTAVDVLALDRSGTGDIHVAEVKAVSGSQAISRTVAALKKIPAHFKYLALFDNEDYRPDEQLLYSADGLGRIGILRVTEDDRGNLSADFRIRPERFRVDPAFFKLVDKFTAGRTADMEVRP
jgi:hypothetical protein